MATIFRFLERQAQDDLDALYRSEWCALAVFQSLDSLGQQ